MNHNSIYRRLFFFMIGVTTVSFIIGGVGYVRGKNAEQLATRVRELEGQLNAKGVIDETAASVSPANSQQPIANSEPKQKPEKNVAQAAEKPAEQSKPTGPAQVIAIAPAVQEDTTQTNWTPPATGATATSTPTPIPTVTIKIKHLGTFTPEVQAGDTALSVLKRAGQQNGFRVRTTEFPPYGEFVDCIGDLCFDDHHYWAFYFNGQYSNVGASVQSIVAGDTSEWKWEGF